MNFVLISAALSSMNANLYLCSRMLFSLARGGFAPAGLGRLSPSGTPVAAILISSVGVGIAVLTSVFSPVAYGYLFGVALGGGILVWLIILLSHLSFRKRREAAGGSRAVVRAPLFPWLQYLGIFLLVAVLVTMGMDTEFWNVGVISASVWVLFLSGVYLFKYGVRRQKVRSVQT
jgi:L-asparagine transporter-like permease